MGKKIEKMKSLGRFLAEKATSKDGKYVTGLVPYAAESMYFSPLDKKIKIAAVLIIGTARTVGLLNPDLSGFYSWPTFVGEYAMLLADSMDHEFKKTYKNRCKNNECSV